MLNIALFSDDSHFFSGFAKDLAARLDTVAQGVCRFQKLPLFQTAPPPGSGITPDLCVVDLRNAPDRGMEFVRQLRQEDGPEVMVIAPGPGWAMEAYDADVASYLVDPPDAVRASELILRRFSHRFQPQEAQFAFRTASGVRLFPAERIVYVEYSGHRMIIHTDLGEPVSTTTMRLSFGDGAAQLLQDPRFVRTHASFLVNILHVARFGQYALTMDTGVNVPVSHARRAEVKRHFSRFFGEGNV